MEVVIGGTSTFAPMLAKKIGESSIYEAISNREAT